MAIESQAGERLESPEVATRPVLLAALGVLLLVFGTVGILAAIYYREVPVQRLPTPEKFPPPRVETKEREERLRIEAEQARRLAGYHWVDRKQGLAQIPIERAMQLLAGEGLQAYAPLARADALSTPAAGAQRIVRPELTPAPEAAPGASTNAPKENSAGGDDVNPDRKSATNADGRKP
jgi:hypothetical protein